MRTPPFLGILRDLSRRPRPGLRQGRRGLVLQHRVREGPTQRGRTPPGCSGDSALPRATALLPETHAHRAAFNEAVFIDAAAGEGVGPRHCDSVIATGRAGCRAHERLRGAVGVPFPGAGGGHSTRGRKSSQWSACEPRSEGFSEVAPRCRLGLCAISCLASSAGPGFRSPTVTISTERSS